MKENNNNDEKHPSAHHVLPHRRVDSRLGRRAGGGATRRYRRCSLRPTTGMKSHDELAMESLQKVLSVDANNTGALYLMALWSQQGGDMQRRRSGARLAAARQPGTTGSGQRQKDVAGAAGWLNWPASRREGNIPGAGDWRSMFNGNTPPAGLAAEYYLTMASDKSLYPQAISELRQYVAQHPQENAPRALGKALTTAEETRREGSPCSSRWPAAIKRRTAACAGAALAGPAGGDEQYYDTGCSGIRDSEVQNYFRERRSGQSARRATPISTAAIPPPRNSSLKRYRPTPDADALAGMGYIAQRSGDYRAASQYLRPGRGPRRRLGDPSSAGGRCTVLRPAGAGQQAYKRGNISGAGALRAVGAAERAQGASAQLFRADVLRHNKDLPERSKRCAHC